MEATPRPARTPRTDGAVPKDPIVDVVKRADYETFALALADDVVFRSPVSRFRFKGRDITAALFERLVKQSDLDHWDVLDSRRVGDAHAVILTTSVRGHQLDLLLLTRFNERRQISEVTGYGRPMASIAIFPAFVYPHLSRRFRGKARGTLVRMLFRPLPRAIERFVTGGLGFGKPPQAAFEEKLATAEAPPAATDGPRSPFRRL